VRCAAFVSSHLLYCTVNTTQCALCCFRVFTSTLLHC